MCCGSDYVSMWQWVRIYFGSNQICYVSYVDQQEGIYFIGNGMEMLLVNNVRVSRKVINDYFWFVFFSQCFNLFVVNFVGFFV